MDQERKHYWLKHIEAAKHFGGSQTAYCKQHGLKASTFSTYKIAFSRSERKRRKEGFAKVAVVKSTPGKCESLPDPVWLVQFLRTWGEYA